MSNLALETIDSSDLISPKPINDNFNKLDPLGKEYVTEYFISGEWWVRKWKSGRMEMGIDDKAWGNINISQPWGSFFTGPQLTFGNYPVAFAGVPTVNITFNSSDAGKFAIYLGWAEGSSKTSSPKFFPVNPGKDIMGHPHFGISAYGRYK